jgi:hypothetical protein
MKVVKRNESCNVEKIANGFIVTVEGQDKNENWITEKIYLADLNVVSSLLVEYFNLEKS